MKYVDGKMMLMRRYDSSDLNNKLNRKIEAFVDVHDQFQYCVHVLHVEVGHDGHVDVNEI